ncbi:hypothetical protein PSTT_10644 [Puccinia striiformis]|uniref:Uncharacterized protein n=1 Tax=Puccinia striiformis TaxID=27350 RepID=A0A2S4V3J7_9BASI|nr:hypothetical protein PSTT_10644 [Puccinia striiformis]
MDWIANKLRQEAEKEERWVAKEAKAETKRQEDLIKLAEKSHVMVQCLFPHSSATVYDKTVAGLNQASRSALCAKSFRILM